MKSLATALFVSIGVAASVGILTFPCVLIGLFDTSGRGSNAVIQFWARLLLRMGRLRVTTLDAQRIPAGPAVFAVNHASALDIPVLFVGLPEFRIVYKRSLALVPFLGWSLWAGRHIAIDRANPFKARRSLDAAARRIHDGTSVVVFPEGTRANPGEILPFKRGSFVLAIQAGVPVVPVSLVGVKKRLPGGLGSFTSGEVTLRVHEPVPTLGRAPESAGELAETVRGIVASGLKEP